MRSLVTNMEDPKNPWDDVPLEVLIEEERKKREEEEYHQERLYLPLEMPLEYKDAEDEENEDEDDEEDVDGDQSEDSVVVIKFI